MVFFFFKGQLYGSNYTFFEKEVQIIPSISLHFFFLNHTFLIYVIVSHYIYRENYILPTYGLPEKHFTHLSGLKTDTLPT